MRLFSRPAWLIRWQKASLTAFLVSALFGGSSLSEEIVTEPADNSLTSTVPITAPFPGMGMPLRTSAPPPAYLSAPHPFRVEVSDLRNLLNQAGPEELTLAEECANELEAKPERAEAESRIRANPLKYHWCFYRMVLGLEETLRKTEGVMERKQTLIATYSRLVVLAQGFKHVFKDRRYVEFAAEHYRRVSEYLFARKLVATKDALADSQAERVAKTFPGWRPQREPGSVLAKYGVRAKPILEGILTPEATPEAEAGRAPASVPAAEPAAETPVPQNP